MYPKSVVDVPIGLNLALNRVIEIVKCPTSLARRAQSLKTKSLEGEEPAGYVRAARLYSQFALASTTLQPIPSALTPLRLTNFLRTPRPCLAAACGAGQLLCEPRDRNVHGCPVLVGAEPTSASTCCRRHGFSGRWTLICSGDRTFRQRSFR